MREELWKPEVDWKQFLYSLQRDMMGNILIIGIVEVETCPQGLKGLTHPFFPRTSPFNILSNSGERSCGEKGFGNQEWIESDFFILQ